MSCISVKLFLKKTNTQGVSSAARMAGSRAQPPPLLPQTPLTLLCAGWWGPHGEMWAWRLNQVRALDDKATPFPAQPLQPCATPQPTSYSPSASTLLQPGCLLSKPQPCSPASGLSPTPHLHLRFTSFPNFPSLHSCPWKPQPRPRLLGE